MSHPTITVVVPVFNGARFLRETLDGVFAQTYRRFEVVVVDDASMDETPRILEEYGDRIRVLRHGANSGSADIPRYEAVESARGEYCAFLDADDRWLPGKLEKQFSFMQSRPEVPLSHTYVRVIDEEGKPLHVRHEGAIPATGNCARELLRHCLVSTSSVMVRKDAWLRAQRKEDLGGYGTEWDFFLAIAREHPIGFLPEVLAEYRLVSGSVSRNWKRTPRDVGAKERILRKRLWEGVAPRGEMIGIIADACCENSQYWRGRRQPDRAAYFALKALRHAPYRGAAWRELAKDSLRCVAPASQG
ncbi:MAG: glycosyltransferase family 2 protein [Kiritimatiellae bacterium]|nr:glycosyltransferase family 2 protein [Kiritimatiellia bacterium]